MYIYIYIYIYIYESTALRFEPFHTFTCKTHLHKDSVYNVHIQIYLFVNI